MRRVDAVYGGEMSAHHYFRDFAYCDSGMIPWLLVAEIMSTTGKTLASLVEERTKAFPCSGEINRTVSDAQALITKVEASTLVISACASDTVRLISPEQGNALVRSSTNDASVLPVVDMISATNNHGIMPLSQ